MIILNKANSNMTRLGVQRAEPGRHYKENPCLIKEGVAWYNPLTGEAVLVEDAGADLPELVRRWYYVPEDFDLKAATHLIRQKALADTRVMGRPSIGSYTIFTTTACNAACSYCFEKGTKTLTMSDATALDVAKYIARTRRRNAAAVIKWFGGEPLVNKQAINIICAFLRGYGIPFRSDFSSNGDLFEAIPDKTLTEEWQTREVQLTLDDIGRGYEKYKGLPAGAYDRLKKAIIRLTDLGIRVVARIHYHPDDGQEPFSRVVDDLKDIQGLSSMYGRIIYDTESEEHYRELLELEDYMAATGKFRFALPRRGSGTHCMADNPRAVCITPEGLLSPCEHYASGETYGSIYNGTTDREMLAEWKAREKHMCDCGTCPLYPACEKIIACPAEGDCRKGYRFYQIETIKRALKRLTAEGGQTVTNGSEKRANADGRQRPAGKTAGQAATLEDLRAQCGVC